MKSELHALLVGIDDYGSPSKPLGGCVNDADAFAELLEARIRAPRQLFLRRLRNREATRNRVIATFREHLGRAERGDTALFFFAGHGSQELPPSLHAASETDRVSETLVACDSRQPDQWDIADKELAVLIAEVARRGAHVVVIVDACHSGTLTRATASAERRLAGAGEPRPAESYWFFGRDDVPADLDAAGGWRLLPRGRHVLLAACRDFEQCRETIKDGRRHGLFSYLLLDTLKRLGPGATYRDLHKEVQVRVNNENRYQLPEATGDLDLTIFDGALAPRRSLFYVRRHDQGENEDGEWRLDAGAIHGIRPGADIAVFPPEATDLDEPLAAVKVTRVDAAESAVKGTLPFGYTTLRAAPARRAIDPLVVAPGPGVGEAFAERVSSSPFLRLTRQRDGGQAIVELRDGSYELRSAFGAGAQVVPWQRGDPETDAVALDQAVEALEHIARWHNVANLSHSAGPLEGAVEMTLHEWLGPPREGPEPQVRSLAEQGEVRLPYRDPGKRGRPGRFTVRLFNRGRRWLYFALFGLDESFAVHRLQGAQGRLLPGYSFWVRAGDGIPASVPENLYELGITQRRDLLVLVVSESDADWSLMEQGRLALSWKRTRPHETEASGSPPPGLPAAFLPRVTKRELTESTDAHLESRWSVEKRVIVAYRPAPVRELDGPIRRLASGVRLTAPEGFRGTAQLHNAPAAAARRHRRWNPPPMPGVDWRPAALAARMGSDRGLWALELHSEKGRITPETPLFLECAAVPEGGVLIAVADDGARGVFAGRSRIEAMSEPARCRIVFVPMHEPAAWFFFYLIEARRYASTGLEGLLGQPIR